MRKISAFVLVFALLAGVLSCPAFAAGQFSFREGITWDMSPEEVKQIEGKVIEDGEWARDNGITTLDYDKNVSRFFARECFLFFNDRLYGVHYEFGYPNEEGETEIYVYLKRAMTSLYGESRFASYEDLDRFAKVMEPVETWDYGNEPDKLVLWDLPDDTTAVLYTSWGECEIAYYHFESLMDLPLDGQYNTENL